MAHILAKTCITSPVQRTLDPQVDRSYGSDHQLSSAPRPDSNKSSTYSFAPSSVTSPAPSELILQAMASLTSRGMAFEDLFYPCQ